MCDTHSTDSVQEDNTLSEPRTPTGGGDLMKDTSKVGEEKTSASQRQDTWNMSVSNKPKLTNTPTSPLPSPSSSFPNASSSPQPSVTISQPESTNNATDPRDLIRGNRRPLVHVTKLGFSLTARSNSPSHFSFPLFFSFSFFHSIHR